MKAIITLGDIIRIAISIISIIAITLYIIVKMILEKIHDRKNKKGVIHSERKNK